MRAPIELPIVGDVDEATATLLVVATFCALPPRAATDQGERPIRPLRR